MKNLFTLLVAALICSSLIAQEKASATKSDAATKQPATTTVQKKKASVKKAVSANYWCSRCDYMIKKPGKCPKHNVTLVKEGNFFCIGDEAHASAKPVSCPDGSACIKMEQAYQKTLRQPDATGK